jgi:uncharacterized protein YdeI (YjbR/CyaY-like superfamily)
VPPGRCAKRRARTAPAARRVHTHRRGGRHIDELPLPHNLRIELNDDPEAWSAFRAVPPSHRREYIGWILAAERPETRARRVEQTVRMVREKAGGGA